MSSCDNLIELGSSCFYGTDSLEILELHNHNFKVNQQCFSNSGLIKVVLPDNLTTLASGMEFYGCSRLEEIVFGSGITKLGTYIVSACDNLKKINRIL